ncbi:hypothetical protein BLNAU_12289 [Blattamonas nauphoetae]|uniref:CCZ1/INTU/HSP4 first Longin domain-containing protein n=1 Tax=Blattamonas nauphoetae TaxID=2049346 RepID=A0ABQ9XK70_9EUKA|nr:hypothetical protein BLNAU_12289 [Blattamonas nauphoetae]
MKKLLFTIFTPPQKNAGEAGEPIIHYFYSKVGVGGADDDENQQSLCVGALFTMLTFGEPLHATYPEFITTTQYKISIRISDGVYFFLGMESTIPEITVRGAHNLLMDYFQFYYRSIVDVRNACCNNDKLFNLTMKDVGKRLLSLLFICYPDSISQTFQPIPYTPLPSQGKRFFLDASQLLDTLETSTTIPIYGGLISYGSSVVCTHLDETLTRLILLQISLGRESEKLSIVDFYLEKQTNESSDTVNYQDTNLNNPSGFGLTAHSKIKLNEQSNERFEVFLTRETEWVLAAEFSKRMFGTELNGWTALVESEAMKRKEMTRRQRGSYAVEKMLMEEDLRHSKEQQLFVDNIVEIIETLGDEDDDDGFVESDDEVDNALLLVDMNQQGRHSVEDRTPDQDPTPSDPETVSEKREETQEEKEARAEAEEKQRQRDAELEQEMLTSNRSKLSSRVLVVHSLGSLSLSFIVACQPKHFDENACTTMLDEIDTGLTTLLKHITRLFQDCDLQTAAIAAVPDTECDHIENSMDRWNIFNSRASPPFDTDTRTGVQPMREAIKVIRLGERSGGKGVAEVAVPVSQPALYDSVLNEKVEKKEKKEEENRYSALFLDELRHPAKPSEDVAREESKEDEPPAPLEQETEKKAEEERKKEEEQKEAEESATAKKAEEEKDEATLTNFLAAENKDPVFFPSPPNLVNTIHADSSLLVHSVHSMPHCLYNNILLDTDGTVCTDVVCDIFRYDWMDGYAEGYPYSLHSLGGILTRPDEKDAGSAGVTLADDPFARGKLSESAPLLHTPSSLCLHSDTSDGSSGTYGAGQQEHASSGAHPLSKAIKADQAKYGRHQKIPPLLSTQPESFSWNILFCRSVIDELWDVSSVVLARPQKQPRSLISVTWMNNILGQETYSVVQTQEATGGIMEFESMEFKEKVKRRHGFYLI